jgi:hypothetical protein
MERLQAAGLLVLPPLRPTPPRRCCYLHLLVAKLLFVSLLSRTVPGSLSHVRAAEKVFRHFSSDTIKNSVVRMPENLSETA